MPGSEDPGTANLNALVPGSEDPGTGLLVMRLVELAATHVLGGRNLTPASLPGEGANASAEQRQAKNAQS
ncbi:MAG: hypothetical protein ACRDZ8_05435, partial [Acidimicrobiales bacterium]